jgi:hypothetical protein
MIHMLCCAGIELYGDVPVVAIGEAAIQEYWAQRAKKDAEEQAEKNTKEQAKRKAEQRAKKEAEEEQARQEAEEQARNEAEQRAKKEAVEQAKKEAEEEEEARREDEQQVRCEAEQQAKKEAKKEPARKEMEEHARREPAELERSTNAKLNIEQQAKTEAEARTAKGGEAEEKAKKEAKKVAAPAISSTKPEATEFTYRVCKHFALTPRSEPSIGSAHSPGAQVLQQLQTFRVDRKVAVPAGTVEGQPHRQTFLRLAECEVNAGGWVFTNHPKTGKPVCLSFDGDRPWVFASHPQNGNGRRDEGAAASPRFRTSELRLPVLKTSEAGIPAALEGKVAIDELVKLTAVARQGADDQALIGLAIDVAFELGKELAWVRGTVSRLLMVSIDSLDMVSRLLIVSIDSLDMVSRLLIVSIDSLDMVSRLLIVSVDSLDMVSRLQVQQLRIELDLYSYLLLSATFCTRVLTTRSFEWSPIDFVFYTQTTIRRS